eukprot:TRINITY_DN39845_c0_g1_i1.p1 TRINITY_DN39845_c0_g1~~TRINITY_DN39845_c0_g1_i1.p1  ORF type:complete len:423 (-),score=16.29 TRINITY_DN39845_c0_g1_i1:74-1300(-)
MMAMTSVSLLLGLQSFSHLCGACRDRFLEPFSSSSIWNTAIGSHANFVHARLYVANGSCGSAPNCEPAASFHNDQEWFLLSHPETDLQVPWIDQGDWGSDDHCKITGKQVTTIGLPPEWTTASDGGRSKAGQVNNNAMGVLLPDNETIVQMQPAYRCAVHSPLLARFGNATDGCPQRFPNTTSIFGDGALGAHGGSGLSGVGGTIRIGELTRKEPIGHALKIELQHQWYFGRYPLQPDSKENQGRRQYVWPATGSDSCSVGAPHGCYEGSLSTLAPGALLAVPSDLAEEMRQKMQTAPGRKILEALTDYGGYIVDDTGAVNSAAICMSSEVNDEMTTVFGYSMTYPHGVSARPDDPGRLLYSDLLHIFQNLHVVTNNAAASVGGGGVPRKPTKGQICGERADLITLIV